MIGNLIIAGGIVSIWWISHIIALDKLIEKLEGKGDKDGNA